MNVSKRVLIKFKVLVDTKPLYTIITFQISPEKRRSIRGRPLKTTRKNGRATRISMACVRIPRLQEEGRDFNLKLEEVKNFLMRVEELKIEFHSVLGELTVGFDLADTAVLELADREPLIILF
ncbi:MAG: hypothetical protein F7B17_01255 [Desulfurococcales archaeon]|nr:hypothetical protein [Desulfurococcales archaeon]